jgi:hypothetical protein
MTDPFREYDRNIYNARHYQHHSEHKPVGYAGPPMTHCPLRGPSQKEKNREEYSKKLRDQVEKRANRGISDKRDKKNLKRLM